MPFAYPNAMFFIPTASIIEVQFCLKASCCRTANLFVAGPSEAGGGGIDNSSDKSLILDDFVSEKGCGSQGRGNED